MERTQAFKALKKAILSTKYTPDQKKSLMRQYYRRYMGGKEDDAIKVLELSEAHDRMLIVDKSVE